MDGDFKRKQIGILIAWVGTPEEGFWKWWILWAVRGVPPKIGLVPTAFLLLGSLAVQKNFPPSCLKMRLTCCDVDHCISAADPYALITFTCKHAPMFTLFALEARRCNAKNIPGFRTHF